ncbi:uncharacterized protein LOC130628860 [Hydractinia symbiolongicarpus]|uniref:uncharacterized protein LOC130628860 n=1 Tax=Hydractinia symbiolongicarpus TaxID=13093 RepID=UPI00254EC11A|nr:uncharacterized protein LOC130628860 [Hydractinia symbiolongicarpus]
MATSSTGGLTHQTLIAKNEYQLKLVTLSNEACDYLRSMLHDPKRGNMPRDEKQLYQALLPFKKKLNHLKKDQLEIVFPQNKKTNSALFDITLLCDILINCCRGIQAPVGGWKIKSPQPNDFSDGAEIIRIRIARNKVMHGRAINAIQYNQSWNNIEAILQRLGYDVTQSVDLKTGCLKDMELFRVAIIQADIEIQKFNIEQVQNDTGKNRDDIKQNKDGVKQIQNENVQNQNEIKKNQVDIIQNQTAITNNERSISRLEEEVKTVKEAIGVTLPTSIDRKLHLKGSNMEQASYMLFHNTHKNLLVQFDDKLPISCVKVTEDMSTRLKKLGVSTDYVVEKKNQGVTLTIYSHVAVSIRSLFIYTAGDEDESPHVFIEDIEVACAHWCDNPTTSLEVMTHNSATLSEQINSISKSATEEKNVEFFCGGKLQRMTSAEYESFGRSYLDRYYKHDAGYVEESMQFPPPMLQDACSILARNIKEVMARSKYSAFTIFTHYNYMEHLKFLKLEGELPYPLEGASVCENRILMFYHNTIMNIRYTETTDAFDIQAEFKAGEGDLKMLAMINKNYIETCNKVMINVVAAPYFEDTLNDSICANCKLLCRKKLSGDVTIRHFFSNILENLPEENNVNKNEEQYMNMVGRVMCFLATRNALYSVPSLSHSVHDQVTSIMLSPQQLRILYGKSMKKTITGPLGSGKTVLALCHLELAYWGAKCNTVIYYVVWNDKSLLKQDVIKYASRLHCKANVTVCIKDIVELAKELEMVKVPNPSQLLASLVKSHVGKILHLIIDELDGECMDKKESLSLKEYLDTEVAVQNSIIVFFPQSIEKHREFVSDQGITQHDKYKYEETGMKILQLNRAMRTSKTIFQFLRAFENKLIEEKVMIKHPVPENKQKQVTSLDDNSAKNTMIFAPNQLQPLQQECQKDLPNVTKPVSESIQIGNVVTLFDEDSAENISLTELLQRPQEQYHLQEQKVAAARTFTFQSGDREFFESPIDIDILAASVNDKSLSDDFRTDIKFNCNSADFIGHNIEGEKPLLIHPATEDMTEEKFIVLLAFVLKHLGLRCNTKRLFIYNQMHQMNIFSRLLRLLDMEYFHYDESTNWKVFKGDATIADILPVCEGYNMLTTHEGSRGTEAAECICIIERDDCKLKHLTLEGMSRATQRLVLVSTSSINSSNILKSSIGHIIKDLVSDHLVEYRLTHSKHRDSEVKYTLYPISDNKINFNVNTRSWQYEELIENIKFMNFQQESAKVENVYEVIFKNLHPPNKVSNIVCIYDSDRSCTISWKNEGFRYTIKITHLQSFNWRTVASNIASNHAYNEYIVDDMVLDEIYLLCVIANNQVGQSDKSVVFYHHKKQEEKIIDTEEIDRYYDPADDYEFDSIASGLDDYSYDFLSDYQKDIDYEDNIHKTVMDYEYYGGYEYDHY